MKGNKIREQPSWGWTAFWIIFFWPIAVTVRLYQHYKYESQCKSIIEKQKYEIAKAHKGSGTKANETDKSVNHNCDIQNTNSSTSNLSSDRTSPKSPIRRERTNHKAPLGNHFL